MGDPSLNYEIEIVQERIHYRRKFSGLGHRLPHRNNSLKKKLKGRGHFFHTKRGFGIIKVISEINENVPDRKRLIDEVLNDPNRDEPGLYCSYVRYI